MQFSPRGIGGWLVATVFLTGCGLGSFGDPIEVAPGGPPDANVMPSASCEEKNNCWDFSKKEYTKNYLIEKGWQFGNCWGIGKTTDPATEQNFLYMKACSKNDDADFKTIPVLCSKNNPLPITLRVWQKINIVGLDNYAAIYQYPSNSSQIKLTQMSNAKLEINNFSCVDNSIKIRFQATISTNGLPSESWVIQKIEILIP